MTAPQGDLILGIDTSARASVALLRAAEPDRPLLLEESRDATSHAEALGPMVRRAVKAHGVPDLVAVGAGPGPFTGLRVGMASADALAFAWGVPLWTVHSLDALAHQVRGALTDARPLFVATDARRREVYWAVYDDEGSRLEGPNVNLPGEAARRALEVLGSAAEASTAEGRNRSGWRPVLAGEGIRLYGSVIREVLEEGVLGVRLSAAADAGGPEFEDLRPHALGVAQLAAEALREGRTLPILPPQYLRESDAVAPAAKTRRTPGASA